MEVVWNSGHPGQSAIESAQNDHATAVQSMLANKVRSRTASSVRATQVLLVARQGIKMTTRPAGCMS